MQTEGLTEIEECQLGASYNKKMADEIKPSFVDISFKSEVTLIHFQCVFSTLANSPFDYGTTAFFPLCLGYLIDLLYYFPL